MRLNDVPAAERFWMKVRKGEPDACWEWTGKFRTDGYGVFRVEKQDMSAHRFSLELHSGEPLRDLHALHHCDNKKCVNPAHLFRGTHSDNMQDAAAKGRMKPPTSRGEANPAAKLTADKVREIKRRYAAGGISTRALASEFGVSQTAIRLIVNGQKWQHVETAP